MEILENKAEWIANYHNGWLSHHQETGQFDWLRYQYAKSKIPISGPGIDLSQSRLALISTAGGYLPEQHVPFDAANDYGDYSIRTFPSTTDLETITYAHDHYDHTAVKDDPQVLLPLRHLDAMVEAGVIGELAQSVISFMGYQPDLGRVVDELFPAILEVLKAEAVTAALLVPA
jgi:hypothetical protein